MMKTELTLQDMTKAELIALINKCYPRLEAQDLRQIRRGTLCQRAHAITSNAMARMEAITGNDPESQRKFREASQEFDRGMALYHQNDVLFKVDFKGGQDGADTHGNY
jgi:hypothetical protein